MQDLAQKLAIEIYVSLKLNFHLSVDSSYVTDPPVVFNTEPISLLESTEIARVLEGIFESFTSKIETFSMQGSGWVLHKLLNLHLHVAVYQPLHGSVFTFRLPQEVYDIRAVVNIQNRCDQCFLYCVAAALYSDPNDVHLDHLLNMNVISESLMYKV